VVEPRGHSRVVFDVPADATGASRTREGEGDERGIGQAQGSIGPAAPETAAQVPDPTAEQGPEGPAPGTRAAGNRRGGRGEKGQEGKDSW
jgi:hypothetical protein